MQQLSVTIKEHNLQCICLTIFVVANPCAVIMDPSLGNPDLKRTLLLNQNKGLDSDSTALIPTFIEVVFVFNYFQIFCKLP